MASEAAFVINRATHGQDVRDPHHRFVCRHAAGAQSLTTPSGNASWQGWLQRQVTVQGAGYSNRQTHVAD